ncbi:MAG: hypothetical protein MUE58_02515 [Chitinophagaceae bacterium]|jgi:hypothetical protein|nr:hypothetical protein [Chitinophagaceae bacterium]
MKTIVLSVLALGLVVAWGGCTKETSFEGDAYTMRLIFRPSANGEPLEFGREYINPLGEDYTVSTFKFYVSHIGILQDLPQPVAEDLEGVFLVDASNDATKTITVNLNGQSFNRLTFQVGVDSILNVSGAQTGALDPMNGMFWTWNSGYIMAKLEGTSTLSTSPNSAITYHIGGFKGDEKTQRTVQLSLPQQQEWVLEKGNVTEILIDVDIDKWFASTHNMFILSHSETMTPGPLSVQYADNYGNLFRIDNIVRRQ